MKKELNYFASKRWEKFGLQELCSTPYKLETDPEGEERKKLSKVQQLLPNQVLKKTSTKQQKLFLFFG
jgi:hypothetical protein